MNLIGQPGRIRHNVHHGHYCLLQQKSINYPVKLWKSRTINNAVSEAIQRILRPTFLPAILNENYTTDPKIVCLSS